MYEYLWIVIVGGIFMFVAAMGIGANDVANAFSTSIGSKALTMKSAVIIATIFEFAGALLMGSHVTETIRKDIANYELPVIIGKTLDGEDVYQMKPFLRSFKYVQETIEDKIQSKNNTFYFFDDMKANLRTAKSLGWVTILIHPDFINQDEEYIDYLFPNIYHALVFFSLKKGQ